MTTTNHNPAPLPPLAAVVQMTSTADVDENLATVARLVRQAAARGAALVVVPECFAFMGQGDGETLRVMEPLDGPLFSRCRAIAQEAGVMVCFGGFPERASDTHAYNAHVVVDARGAIAAVYRKLHLFDVQLGGARTYKESDAFLPGKDVVTVDSPVGLLGPSVCYDLRFSELYLTLAARGARVLLVPAAFTLLTGKEHWEALLRARAIETQCYVLAAAQTGRHNERRDTFGHAMIIDPWGTVIAQCQDGAGIAVAPIDLAFLDDVRRRVPVWSHRRTDVLPAFGDAAAGKKT